VILACYLAGLLFIGILAIIAKVFVGMNLWKFLRYTARSSRSRSAPPPPSR
jgi:aerobic C4-dicarboxylate transport protein